MSMPPVNTPATLSAINTHAQQQQQPSAAHGGPAVGSKLNGVTPMHECQASGAGLDLEALMKAVWAEGAALYAAATALNKVHNGE